MTRQRIQTDALPRIVPVLALRAQGAADALDISLHSFLALVKEGKMPKPINVPGHAGLVLYDFEELRSAWRALVEASTAAEADCWD